MKVVLLDKVAGLGEADDIKEVAEGYAVNFLFPRHLAVLASPAALEKIEKQKQKKKRDEEKDLREQQSLAGKLEGLALVIREKANEEGSLYAAIGPQKISDELAKLGFQIAKDKIIIKQPIKEAGEYEVLVKLRHRLEAKVSVVVNPPEEKK